MKLRDEKIKQKVLVMKSMTCVSVRVSLSVRKCVSRFKQIRAVITALSVLMIPFCSPGTSVARPVPTTLQEQISWKTNWHPSWPISWQTNWRATSISAQKKDSTRPKSGYFSDKNIYGVYTIALAESELDIESKNELQHGHQSASNSGPKFLGISGNIYFNEKYKDGRPVYLGPAGTSAAMPAASNTAASPMLTANYQKWYLSYQFSSQGIAYYTIRNVFSGQLLAGSLSIASSHKSTAGVKDKAAANNKADLLQSRILDKPEDRQLWALRPVNNNMNVKQTSLDKTLVVPKSFQIINKATGLVICKGAGVNTDSLAVELRRPATDNATDAQWTLRREAAISYRDDAVVGFFERNNPMQGSVAFDQGNTIPLQWGANKGKVLWVTQDAWDGQELKENGWFSCQAYFRYRNSVIIQPSIHDWDPAHTLNITRTDSRQNKPRQICDVIDSAEFAWPSVGIEIGSHVYIQCAEGDGLGPQKSQSLYQLTENKDYQWEVKRLTPKNMTSETRINYSAAMIKSADGYVYVFGFQGISYGYALHLHVARFAVNDPMNWTFWDGENWASQPVTGKNASVASGLGTASVAYINGKYVFMTMDQGFNCDTARNIYMATSKSPTGPFTPLKKVYTISEYLYGSYARYYTPVIHPEFDNGHRELLVTYCLNYSACGLSECVDGYQDPYFYRIKGVRVPYDLIGL